VHEKITCNAEGILEYIMTGRVRGTSLDDELEVKEEEADQQPPNPPPSHSDALQHVHSLMQFVPTITLYEYQFCFHDMCFTLSSMFQYGVFQLLLMKYLLTWAQLSNQGYVLLQCQEFRGLLCLYQKRHGGRE
jgi:hypothetical protein